MIKNIIILILSGLLLWMSKENFTLELPKYPKQELLKISELTEKQSVPKQIHNKEKLKEKVQAKKMDSPIEDKTVTLDLLLKQNKFYDALAFYLMHTMVKNQQKIEQYLIALSASKPYKALEFIPLFLDEVPQSIIGKYLIDTHIKLKQYTQAIALIMEAKEHYVSDNENNRLDKQLSATAMKYIDELVEKKEFVELIAFLEEMIVYDSSNSFYTFRLAQLYLELDKTEQASPLLDELQYDETYAQKVKSYIQEINLDKGDDKGYEYAIALSKRGQHYVVTTVLDGTTFNLMLDTGASYIYIDEDKGSMLEVIQTNLRLQTAGDDVDANLCKVATMQVGNLTLHDIKVTTAPFKRDGIDGLLGMNFLNRFEFYINQEESMLYLNPK